MLGRLRNYAIDHPADPLVVWREHSAAGFEDYPVDCAHCWELANPALGDFLARDGLEACLPPKMREASFRRVRLCQLTDQLEEAWLPPGSWVACCDPTLSIPDGTEVVLAFDGSFNGDTTVLVVATVDQRLHIDLVELWEPGGGQVPIVDVEQAIRQACRRWRVLEIAADPFRWARSLQLLDGEGLPVLEYPQSPGRMTPATARFYEAVINGALTHSGDSRLARHVGNAVLREDTQGARLAKERRDSPRRIDAAVAAVMAHDRAATLAGVVRDSIYISHAAVVTSAAAPLRPASPDGFVWPPGRVRKRGVPGAAELIAHAAPSGDQAPRSRWPRVRIPYPGRSMGIVSAAESSATGTSIGPTR